MKCPKCKIDLVGNMWKECPKCHYDFSTGKISESYLQKKQKEEEENRTVVTFKLCNHNFERDNEYVPVFSWISDKDNDYFESEAMDIKYPSTIYLNGTVCESHIDSSKNVKTIYNR